jgi:hypothetical protein
MRLGRLSNSAAVSGPVPGAIAGTGILAVSATPAGING